MQHAESGYLFVPEQTFFKILEKVGRTVPDVYRAVELQNIVIEKGDRSMYGYEDKYKVGPPTNKEVSIVKGKKMFYVVYPNKRTEKVVIDKFPSDVYKYEESRWPV